MSKISTEIKEDILEYLPIYRRISNSAKQFFSTNKQRIKDFSIFTLMYLGFLIFVGGAYYVATEGETFLSGTGKTFAMTIIIVIFIIGLLLRAAWFSKKEN